MKISEQSFVESAGEFFGYCKVCDDITEYGGVEGDAEGYQCPSCNKFSVMGVELALVSGYLVIKARDKKTEFRAASIR